MLASRDLRAYPMGDRYRDLTRRLGHDFSASIALMERLPIFIEGPAHKRVRKAMALRNEANKPVQLAAVSAFIDRFAQGRLRPGESVDLFEDFGKPLFEAMVLSAPELPTPSLTGRGADIARLVTEFPLLFFPSTSLKRRLAINALLASIVAGQPDDILDELALLVLGVYPLSGSLALSLHATIADNPGARLDAIPWPAEFPQSSLHFVDRESTRETTIAGEHFAAGERIRCMLRGGDWNEAQVRSLFFGAGLHTCLGKQLSETIWAMTTQAFAACPLVAEALPLVMQPDQEPFRLPARAQVRLSAGADAG